MAKTRVTDGETPQSLSARVCRPLCMILRANRLFSTSWLLPGREIDVPDAGFCETDSFPCPSAAVRLPAVERRMYFRRQGESRLEAARASRVPLRLIPEERAFLTADAAGARRIYTVLPGDTVRALCRDEALFRSINSLTGPLYPGMKVLTE